MVIIFAYFFHLYINLNMLSLEIRPSDPDLLAGSRVVIGCHPSEGMVPVAYGTLQLLLDGTLLNESDDTSSVMYLYHSIPMELNRKIISCRAVSDDRLHQIQVANSSMLRVGGTVSHVKTK